MVAKANRLPLILDKRKITRQIETNQEHPREYPHLLAADPIRQGAGIVLVGVYYVCTREY